MEEVHTYTEKKSGQKPSPTLFCHIACLFVVLTCILFMDACNKDTTNKLNPAEREAQGLADSLRDRDELLRWMQSYERQGEKRASLIMRQVYGKSLRDASDFEGAITQHDSCLTLARELKDTVQIIKALNNQGTNMRRLGDNQSAADLHYAALELCDEFSDKTSDFCRKNRVRSLNGLGNVLQSLGNYEAAEEYLKQALEGEKTLGSETGQAINLANLGSIKKHYGDFDSAHIYYIRSMEMNRKAHNDVGIALCYHYLGEMEEQLGNTEKAIANFQQSYNIAKPTGDLWHWLESCDALAHAFLTNGQKDSASKYIRESMEAASKINSMEHLVIAYDMQARLEHLCGLDQQAVQDIYTSLAYKDSVQSEEDTQHMQNLRINYETKRRIREVSDAETRVEAEKTTKRIIIWSAAIILIVLCSAIVIQLRANRIRKHAAKTLEHANLQLLKASEERQQFYRNITHQLRTPLTVVIGMVKQLETHINEEDEQGRVELEATQRQSRELQELVNRLIKASKEGTDLALTDVRQMPIERPQPTPGKEGNKTGKEEDATVPKNGVVGSENAVKRVENRNVTPLTSKLTQGANVLIAEDNDDVATLIQNIFENNGYIARRASDGQEALEMLMNEDLPDLVISDIAMPRMDGLELIRHIREDETMNHLPIIVVSARVEDSERLEGLDAGAEVYLAKPFIVDELLLRAHKLLEQRAVLRRKFSSQEESQTLLNNLENEEKAFFTLVNETIDAHIADPGLTSSVLAEKIFMSRSQLNRRIKNLTGDDTSHYIRNRRMVLACKLLTTTTLPIGAIETQCGFDTVGYFSRTFRSIYNMSPTEYRKTNSK